MALKSIPAVMQEMDWQTVGGCHSCRPALNYYLLSDWPLEHQDDRQSRFVNERNHANIQKDGTYSVGPRMWGGATTPAELRAIADAADKFAVPMVKVTGGQRIDLLGVRENDLPAIWADLNAAGMVSGHAYSKGLRKVKTWVGSEFCRFGTQDSTSLGIRLEKLLWGSWTPAKVKLGVSGCPRNCAEATCKDVGVVCVDSGHLHRIYKWVAKVGPDGCRAQVVDDPANRRALHDRFMLSQSVYQHDPWAAEPKTRRDFAPLMDFSREAAE